MERYTLLVMTKDKVVHMRVFNSMRALLDAKRYFVKEIKDTDLKQVDRFGYVWFVEVTDDETE